MIRLEVSEREELSRLYQVANTPPVIAFSLADGLAERDLASLAHELFWNYCAQLGEKYGFNPERVGINTKTGEVFDK